MNNVKIKNLLDQFYFSRTYFYKNIQKALYSIRYLKNNLFFYLQEAHLFCFHPYFSLIITLLFSRIFYNATTQCYDSDYEGYVPKTLQKIADLLILDSNSDTSNSSHSDTSNSSNSDSAKFQKIFNHENPDDNDIFFYTQQDEEDFFIFLEITDLSIKDKAIEIDKHLFNKINAQIQIEGSVNETRLREIVTNIMLNDITKNLWSGQTTHDQALDKDSLIMNMLRFNLELIKSEDSVSQTHICAHMNTHLGLISKASIENTDPFVLLNDPIQYDPVFQLTLYTDS